ncbi:hypothetical protein P378_05090 [Desulforamulus profundi]|uniref:DUF2680 domain-containing protein n=2 Tax=Desulforamulus TaxID=2916693 RepID=A0A2C6LKR4_9FIRM|nr:MULTISPECIES: DUF2680 domain-containing protein [Desulforamulus]PHJ39180.1 hypothetical protein P378_05090 [Desulforamulus profundi]SHE51179.1 Protein of unknown function [Desulforamulus putei DSM 12395]
MKRKLIAGIVTVALGALMVPAAFAAIDNNQPDNATNTVNNSKNQQFFNQMFDQHKTWLDKAVKDGKITEEQAKTWNQHFEQMKDFHSKNGMGPMMNGGMMNMMGNGSGMGPGMMGNGTGMGPGMIGNFNTPTSN